MAGAFMPRMHDIEQTVVAAIAPLDFGDFFRANVDDLYGALWLVTRDRHEAEEIAQDAFVKVWERWDRVAGLDDPRGYLYVTAMNAWRSHGRRTSMALRRLVHVIPPDDAMAAVDASDFVVRALAPLPPRQRAALVLTDLLGFTSEEASRAIGIRPSSVRVLAKRAREHVRADMEA